MLQVTSTHPRVLVPQVKITHPRAVLPVRAYQSAAWDLFAVEPAALRAGARVTIDLGIAIAIPDGWCGLVLGRSGNTALGRLVETGLIDADYRGSIAATIQNNGNYEWVVRPGDRIAQLLLVPCLPLAFEVVAELPPSERGERGFGSSGK